MNIFLERRFLYGFLMILSSGIRTESATNNSTRTGSNSLFNLAGTGSSGGSPMYAPSANNGGCPQLPSNCNYDCLSIGSDGCVQCTCAKQASAGPGSLTGGSTLSSSGARNNSASASMNPFSVGSPSGNASISAFSQGNPGGALFSNSSSIGKGASGSPFVAGTVDAQTLTGGSTLTSSGSSGAQGTSSNGGNPYIAGSSFLNPLTGGSTLTSSGSNITAAGGSGNPFLSSTVNGLNGQTSGSMSPFMSASTGNSSIFPGGNAPASGSVAQASMNNNGCPAFPSNCGSTCATLDANGCPICTCTIGGNNSTSLSGSLSSGSLSSSQTGSSASQNLNDCPTFTNDCTAECVTIDSKGCPICTCHNAGGSHSGPGSSHTGSSNANGCPVFYSNCPAECTTLDTLGCPICTCNSSGSSTPFGTGSSSAGSQIPSHGTGVANNNNGCPAFPTNCHADCATLDGRGCPICTCTIASGNSSGPHSGYQSEYNNLSPGGGMQANGCPHFPDNCPASCTTTSYNGCPVCSCSVPPSSGSQTSSGQTTGSANIQCPPITANCYEGCLYEDSNHCIRCNDICNDNHKSSSGSQSNNSSSGNIPSTASPTSGVLICSAFDPNCPASCASFDAKGCLVCTCPVTTTTATTAPPVVTNTAPITICPAFDGANCRVDCLAMDTRGCLICNCGPTLGPTSSITTPSSVRASTQPQNIGSVTTFAPTMPGGSGSGSGAGTNACPPFDASCAVDCTSVDAMGCYTCSCPNGSYNSSSNGPGGSMGSTGTGIPGNNCPPFDVMCPSGCASIDAQGCLHCTCSITSTAAPAVSSGGTGTTVAPLFPVFPGSGTSTGNGSPTGNGNGCPPFDASCTPDCTAMDAMGCLTCSCSGTSGNNTTGSGSSGVGVGGAGNKNGCPVFDLTCPPGCANVDSQGCLTCTCSGPTTPSSSDSGGGSSGIGGGNANNCPPVDVLSCQPSCLTMDQNGCVLCTCSGTTTSVPHTTQSHQTTSAPVKEIPIVTNNPLRLQSTSVQCPSFDATCPAHCTAVDSKGCPRCSCSGTTRGPISTTLKSTPAPATTTSNPPRQTTNPPQQTTNPQQQTTYPPQQTSRAPGVCPPVRCVYPCDVGVSLGSDNCPVCRCRTITTTALP